MSKTFLIAGGAGFIGTNLSKKLLLLGHDVIVYDNLITGKKENIKFLEGLKTDGFSFINDDITDAENLYFHLGYAHLDGIFHLASLASPPFYVKYPLETMLVGSLGTHNLLDLSIDSGCRFLFSSTSEVYGDPLEHPQKESYFGNVNCVGKRACYDESKRYAEALINVFSENVGADVRIARIFNTYGPFMRIDDGRVLTNFIQSALSDGPVPIHGTGEQTRSFCFVDDTVEGLWRLFNSDYTGPINIGNPNEEVSVLEVWEKISEKLPNSCDLKFVKAIGNDPKTRKPDITLAKRELGWEPSVDFDVGLSHLINWCKERFNK